MMSSKARVKFIKTKVIFRYHTKGLSNQVLSDSDHEIKSYSCSTSSTKIPVPKWEKRKSKKKFYGLQNGAIRGLQMWASFRDYKSGKEGLQIGAALGISNWGKEISNRGRNHKSGQ